MKHSAVMIMLAAGALVGGCASDTPRVDAQLGKSVAHVVRAQTYNAAAAANPPELAPETGDGQRLKNVLDAYRKEASKERDQVARVIEFEAGR